MGQYTALSMLLMYLIIQCVDALKAALGVILVRRGIWVNNLTV